MMEFVKEYFTLLAVHKLNQINQENGKIADN